MGPFIFSRKYSPQIAITTADIVQRGRKFVVRARSEKYNQDYEYKIALEESSAKRILAATLAGKSINVMKWSKVFCTT
jgi:hypothetical protein